MTDAYLSPIWISLRTVLTATLLTFFLGLAAARWMAHYRGRFQTLIDGIFILPLVLPPTVVGYVLLILFGKHGPLGVFFSWFDVTIVFSWWATVISAAVMAFPLMYMTGRSGFEQVEPNIEDAARTMGAGPWRVFWTITFPLAWPGIVAGLILALARTMGEFGATLMLAGNIPGRTATIPVAIYFAIQAGDNRKALILVVIVLVLSLAALAGMSYWKGRQSLVRGLDLRR